MGSIAAGVQDEETLVLLSELGVDFAQRFHIGRPANTGNDVTIYESTGCARCRHTGYRGRLGLFEILNITDEIRALIVNRATSQEIGRTAEQQGMRRLRDDALAKVRNGDTTLAEIARVLG
jgi:type II secretory ATPase GspE/PulE/Tfp pilus assembly ATPase PilB-like protein